MDHVLSDKRTTEGRKMEQEQRENEERRVFTEAKKVSHSLAQRLNHTSQLLNQYDVILAALSTAAHRVVQNVHSSNACHVFTSLI